MLSSKYLKEKLANSRHRLKEKLKAKFVIIILFFLVVFFFISNYINEIKSYLDGFILAYGLLAIFLTSFFLDILMQPIGPEIPILTGVLLGLNPFFVFVAVLLASGLATMLSYYIGFKFGAKGFQRFYGDKKYKKLVGEYNKYHFIVPIAALTPIPYVPICWISGIMKMHKTKFFLYAVGSRSVRLALVTIFAAGVS
jgi:membrane protein YqaA with SNARE-associated domain